MKPMEINVVYVEVGKEPYIAELRGPDYLAMAKEFVLGPVEFLWIGGRVYILCNENGRLLDMPVNRCGLFGSFLVVGKQSGKWVGLSDEDQRRVLKWLDLYKEVRPAPQLPRTVYTGHEAVAYRRQQAESRSNHRAEVQRVWDAL